MVRVKLDALPLPHTNDFRNNFRNFSNRRVKNSITFSIQKRDFDPSLFPVYTKDFRVWDLLSEDSPFEVGFDLRGVQNTKYVITSSCGVAAYSRKRQPI